MSGGLVNSSLGRIGLIRISSTIISPLVKGGLFGNCGLGPSASSSFGALKLLTTTTHRTIHATATLPPRRGSSRRGFLWPIVIGAGVGTAIGGLYALIFLRESRGGAMIPQYIPKSEGPTVLHEPPAFVPSRSFKFPGDNTGVKITLFQYQTCPFCCKVRAMLNYFGVSYDIVEVNPVLRTQLKWSNDYKKVPILIVETPEGETLQLNDSSMIVSALFSYVATKRNGMRNKSDSEGDSSMSYIANCYPTIKYKNEKGDDTSEIMNKYFLMLGSDSDGRTKEEIINERKWRQWVDTVYVHTLSPNIYRTFQESLDSFNYFDQVGEWEKHFSTWERSLVIYVGAFAMWLVGKKLQARHHLHNDVRKSLYEESDYWLANVKKNGGNFMGGDKPNLADLAVYGVLSSIEGCQAFRDLSNNSKIVSQWYRKVQNALQHSE